jgi:AraC family transcriptional regulator
VRPCVSSLDNRKCSESSSDNRDPRTLQFAGLSGEVMRRRTAGPYNLAEIFYPLHTVLPWHAHSQAYLTFLLEGAFDEQYSGGSTTWRRGAARFLPAAEMHEDRIQAGSRCLHVITEPVALDQLRRRFMVPQKPAGVNGLAATWLAHRMHAEFSRRDTASAIAIEGLILETLAEIARAANEPGMPHPPEWLKRATEIVETRFLERLSLAAIASEVGVHYVHVSRQFHKYNGCTVGELIRRRRVQYACHLLAYSQTPLAQVALICGFSDQSHLSFLFKRCMGVSPSRFRTLASLEKETTMAAATDGALARDAT